MLLKELFAKPIDRDIKGVIKVGQGDDENIRQELEEYVVTRELQKYFGDFFAAYKKGITGNTDKMGVWISGFFGSGKSHFLKILSYLLENRQVSLEDEQNKTALDFFVDDKKIADPMVLADIKLATDLAKNTDVVLFNIDSKGEQAGKKSETALVLVFLRVFNEMQGLCGSNPHLADLERNLVEAGRFDEFKTAFAGDYGKPWEESRHKFDFIQDSVVDVLDEMGFMSEAAARNWCEKATEPYAISIENFAKLVKSYIDTKEANHHVAFLVDEIGQYIGEDSKLMLNLQTITEDLGTYCHGKAWVIVTSQQDIDATVKDMGARSNDFSKIQGRFDTRLALSSANVDEVIKKRILKKNETATQTLELLYEQNTTIIKNLIFFTGSEKKLYADEKDFADVYPFVPYQFNLLGDVLTSIRQHGASGKHLSEGERSMLALFKESAVDLKDKQTGVLVPFNTFYDALNQFLDHSHRGVIIRALDNKVINPDELEECFPVNVLKTLFMVKYVKEIEANIDNITSLMIGSVETDRIQLKTQVEEALKLLIGQTLVQKNGELYVFLTDEEQEINREIDSQNVEMAELIGKVSELIFEDIYKENKYRYPKFNGRYNFAFNQVVDDRPYKSGQGHDIGVHIITPSTDMSTEDSALRMLSSQSKEVLVVLPESTAFLEELRISLKIEKYLRLNSSASLAKYATIRDAKNGEMRTRGADAKLFLTEALKEANLYANGDKVQVGSKDVTLRINEALGRLVDTVYHKLGYIDTPMIDTDIRALFKESGHTAATLEDGKQPNTHAQGDMLHFISANTVAHTKTSMKTLKDRFMRAPYGFVDEDVEWLVAKLFKEGTIAFMVNGENVTIHNKTTDELIRFITKKEFVEKLLTERRQKPQDSQLKSAQEVLKDLFVDSRQRTDDDILMRDFIQHTQKLLDDIAKIEYQQGERAYPGKSLVSEGKALLRPVTHIQDTLDFFEIIHKKRDDFLDFAEDYEPLKAFFEGGQKTIFDDALRQMKIYEESKNFITDDQVAQCADGINAILKNPKPYREIPSLPDLLAKFREAYMAVLEPMEEPVNTAIEDAKTRVFDALEGKPYAEALRSTAHKQFSDLQEKMKTCHNVSVLRNIELEADSIKTRLLNDIHQRDEALARQHAEEAAKTAGEGTEETTPPMPAPKVKKQKTVSIKAVNHTSSWQVESEQELDAYLARLRQQIVKELAEDTIVHIEF